MAGQSKHASHTAENILLACDKILSDFGLKKEDGAWTTDRAANMLRAFVALCESEGITCAAHALHLALRKSWRIISEEDEAFKNLRTNVMSHVLKVRKTIMKSLLSKQGKAVTNFIKTRWGSNILMFLSVLVAKEESKLLYDEHYSEFVGLWDNIDWELLELVVKFYHPFLVLFEDFSREKLPSIHLAGFHYQYMIENLCKITARKTKNLDRLNLMKNSMKEALQEKFERILKPVHFDGMKLTYVCGGKVPAFFKDMEGGTDAEAEERIIERTKKQIQKRLEEEEKLHDVIDERKRSTPKKSNKRKREDIDLEEIDHENWIISRHESKRRKTDINIEKEARRQMKEFKNKTTHVRTLRTNLKKKHFQDPLLYFKQNKMLHPDLSEVSKQVFVVLVASVSSERAFSDLCISTKGQRNRTGGLVNNVRNRVGSILPLFEDI